MRAELENDLRATSLRIENFRCISSAKINFDRNVTVFIGKNGSGKTSILDAFALGLEVVQIAWELSTKSRPIPRPGRLDPSDVYGRTKFSSIELILHSSDENIFGPRDVRALVHSEASRAGDAFSALVSEINSMDQRVHKPLFIYYGQGRAFENGRASRRSELSGDSLDGDLRAISNLEEWWDERDAEEARRVRDSHQYDYRDPQLEAIRQLLQRIEGFEDIFYSATMRPKGLYFKKRDGAQVHVSKLSSGERSYIILLADLARRLQLSSPNKDLSEIPGVVLIDEIELNLHPAWQSEIIPTIREVFPACQFVITTHSPQVLSAVEAQNVRIVRRGLDGEVTLDVPLGTRGRSSNFLLEGVFDSSERLPRVDKMIHDFNDSIEHGDLKAAERLLAEIKVIVEGRPPELLVLAKRLRELKSKS
jgi:predicted ATP-binding protein involved in virulence